MSVEEKVRVYFHADAARFDSIYEEEKGPITRFIDHVWRGVVRRRLDLAVEKLAPFEGRTYLDVGTGSGRFCHAYALKGARKCVGVDFAPAMIEIANKLAADLKFADRCDFRVGGFPEAVSDGCPLFLYTESQTRDLLKQAGIEKFEWIELDRDYVVVGRR